MLSNDKERDGRRFLLARARRHPALQPPLLLLRLKTYELVGSCRPRVLWVGTGAVGFVPYRKDRALEQRLLVDSPPILTEPYLGYAGTDYLADFL